MKMTTSVNMAVYFLSLLVARRRAAVTSNQNLMISYLKIETKSDFRRQHPLTLTHNIYFLSSRPDLRQRNSE